MTALLAEDPEEDAYAHALNTFARSHPKPRAIVVISAHGSASHEFIEISAGAHPSLIYDFSGFPKELYQIKYRCPGDPDLSARIASLLLKEKMSAVLNASLGLDHGVWVPLSIMYPEADIPVVQIHPPYPEKPETFLKLGKSLAALRNEGILIVGSGGAVHNLRELVWHQKQGEGAQWAQDFENWLIDRLKAKDVTSLIDYAEAAPSALKAQPTDEHLLPLFFTLGASLPGDQMYPIFQGIQYHSLSMFSFCLSPKKV
jgi:4,5-DOPA dioxygenase extradiol